MLTRLIKKIFITTNTLPVFDRISYWWAIIKNYRKNKHFIKRNPNFTLPPDYYLYETYLLDYQQYKEDGIITAKEVIEWTEKYTIQPFKILEWGCGVSRVVRHLPVILSKENSIFACDINADMIKWNTSHIPNISFKHIDYIPPTGYNANCFNLIYGLSVFTHIEHQYQKQWVEEIWRILTTGGIFLFTTHGRRFFEKLDDKGLAEITKKGVYTISYTKKGHRMMTTFNTFEGFSLLLKNRFEILEYYDGDTDVTKTGGQDLWIVKKI